MMSSHQTKECCGRMNEKMSDAGKWRTMIRFSFLLVVAAGVTTLLWMTKYAVFISHCETIFPNCKLLTSISLIFPGLEPQNPRILVDNSFSSQTSFVRRRLTEDEDDDDEDDDDEEDDDSDDEDDDDDDDSPERTATTGNGEDEEDGEEEDETNSQNRNNVNGYSSTSSSVAGKFIPNKNANGFNNNDNIVEYENEDSDDLDYNITTMDNATDAVTSSSENTTNYDASAIALNNLVLLKVYTALPSSLRSQGWIVSGFVTEYLNRTFGIGDNPITFFRKSALATSFNTIRSGMGQQLSNGGDEDHDDDDDRNDNDRVRQRRLHHLPWTMYLLDQRSKLFQAGDQISWWQYEIFYSCVWPQTGLPLLNQTLLDEVSASIQKQINEDCKSGVLQKWLEGYQHELLSGTTVILDLVVDPDFIPTRQIMLPPPPPQVDNPPQPDTNGSNQVNESPFDPGFRRDNGTTSYGGGGEIPGESDGNQSATSTAGIARSSPDNNNNNLLYRNTVGAWTWQRYLGLWLLIATAFGSFALMVLGRYSSRRRREQELCIALGDLATKEGVDHILKVGWATNRDVIMVYDKSKRGYLEGDSMLIGGYEQEGWGIDITQSYGQHKPELSFTQIESSSSNDR